MTELRQRMDNDLLVRGMAERTRESYLAAVTRLARHYHRPPDQLSPEEVQAYWDANKANYDTPERDRPGWRAGAGPRWAGHRHLRTGDLPHSRMLPFKQNHP